MSKGTDIRKFLSLAPPDRVLPKPLSKIATMSKEGYWGRSEGVAGSDAIVAQ